MAYTPGAAAACKLRRGTPLTRVLATAPAAPAHQPPHTRDARAAKYEAKGETPVNGMYLRCRGCVQIRSRPAAPSNDSSHATSHLHTNKHKGERRKCGAKGETLVIGLCPPMPQMCAPMPQPAALSSDSSRATPHLRTHNHKREARAPQNKGHKARLQ